MYVVLVFDVTHFNKLTSFCQTSQMDDQPERKDKERERERWEKENHRIVLYLICLLINLVCFIHSLDFPFNKQHLIDYLKYAQTGFHT